MEILSLSEFSRYDHQGASGGENGNVLNLDF